MPPEKSVARTALAVHTAVDYYWVHGSGSVLEMFLRLEARARIDVHGAG